jgi:hypothetical protein
VTCQIHKKTYPTYREADRKSIDSSFFHTLVTLSKGTLAFFYATFPVRAGVARTSDMRPAIDPSLSLTTLYSLQKSTLSKGTLAYIRHVSRTSRRCANQRLRPAIDPSLSLTTLYSLQKSTLSKGTLAYIRHVSRTSRRCANQRLRPAIDPSLSLTTLYSLQKSTMSKGTLAYLRHVSRTSRRCANQRHATSPIDLSLSLTTVKRKTENSEQNHESCKNPKSFTCVLVMSKKCPVYDVLSLRRE